MAERRISIVISSYNYGRFLRRCVDSALNQAYENFEVIVVDDGSSDGSLAILESYSERIKLIAKSNGGQGSAFNRGFEASTGEIIFFLDSDDVLLPQCLFAVASEWKDEYASVHFGYDVIGAEGQVTDTKEYWVNAYPTGDLRSHALCGGINHPPTTANAFAKSYLEKVLPMPEEHWPTEPDMYLCFLAALHGSIGEIPRTLCLYRRHGRNHGSVWHEGIRVNALKRRFEKQIFAREAVSNEARKLGLTLTAEPLEKSPWFLKNVVCFQKMDRGGSVPLGGLRESGYGASMRTLMKEILRNSHMALRLKLTYLVWAAALFLTPRRIAGTLIALTLSR